MAGGHGNYRVAHTNKDRGGKKNTARVDRRCWKGHAGLGIPGKRVGLFVMHSVGSVLDFSCLFPRPIPLFLYHATTFDDSLSVFPPPFVQSCNSPSFFFFSVFFYGALSTYIFSQLGLSATHSNTKREGKGAEGKIIIPFSPPHTTISGILRNTHTARGPDELSCEARWSPGRSGGRGGGDIIKGDGANIIPWRTT